MARQAANLGSAPITPEKLHMKLLENLADRVLTGHPLSAGEAMAIRNARGADLSVL